MESHEHVNVRNLGQASLTSWSNLQRIHFKKEEIKEAPLSIDYNDFLKKKMCQSNLNCVEKKTGTSESPSPVE